MTSSSRPEPFVFEPPLPGSWTLIAFTEANHEAAHALACVLLGVPVQEARIDRPDVGVFGHVVHDKIPENWKAVVVSLAPHIVENRVPRWPLSLDEPRAGSDEFWAAVKAFELTKAEYYAAIAVMEELLARPPSKRALRALSGALLECGAIDGEEVRAIVEAETVKAENAESGKAIDAARAATRV